MLRFTASIVINTRGGRGSRLTLPWVRFPSREQHVSGVLPRPEEKCDDAPRELLAYHPFGGVRPDGPRRSPAPHRHHHPDDLQLVPCVTPETIREAFLPYID